MTLRPGTRLGAYEVTGALGAGGMGEVYRAHDARLQRDVAIKVLPAALASHPRRLRRLEREARALAALSHANIATVFAVADLPLDTPDGDVTATVRAIVMELVTGDDLSHRLRRGPLRLSQALDIARQVADALAAAHDAGIVHRDLKPANIKVRPDGSIKVLDFGLAQQVETSEPDDGADDDAEANAGAPTSAAEPPTLTLPPSDTHAAGIAGTAAYMSPEQAAGLKVDKRTDVWAFGVVLFEMLTGRRPFDDSGRAATEPDWSRLPATTPPAIRRLLSRCLRRSPRDRLHDLADARLDLEDAMSGRDSSAPTSSSISWWRVGLFTIAGMAAGIVLALALSASSAAGPALAHVRLGIEPAATLMTGGMHPSVILPAGGAHTAIEWAPDGRTLAFIGEREGVRRIHLRDLTAAEARPLPGTEGVHAMTFSSTGEEIAFWAADALQKIRVAGGPPVRLTTASEVNGLSWQGGQIVFAIGTLWTINADGTGSRRLIPQTQLVRYGLPRLLPDGRAVLFTEYRRQWTSGNERVMVLPLATDAVPRVLIEDAADARYLPSGHLTFLRRGTLFVVPFNAETLHVAGDATAVLRDVSQATAGWDSADLTLAGQYALSSLGALAYVRSTAPEFPGRELIGVDRKGHVTPLGAPARAYRNHLEVSPDGAQLGLTVQTTTGTELYAFHLQRRTLTRIAERAQGETLIAAWSSADEIALSVIDNGGITAAIATPDAASLPVPVPGSQDFWASSLSRQRRLTGMREGDVWVYALDEPGIQPGPLARTATAETQPAWSSDGRWLAYTSRIAGRREVYRRPYPEASPEVVLSANGGHSPVWHAAGRELYYVEPGDERDRVMVVRDPMAAQPAAPVELFNYPRGSIFQAAGVWAAFVVSPDGQRFYSVRDLPTRPNPVMDIHLMMNFAEDIRTRLR